MNKPYSFSIDQMNGIVEDTYAKIINECEYLKKNTNCPNAVSYTHLRAHETG